MFTTTTSRQTSRQGGHRLTDTTPVDMSRVVCLVLAGGQGTRLFPLTQTRCKPGIPFGGHYKLIDVALSNAINSRCRKTFVITQFFSSGLHQHIHHTFSPSSFGQSIEVLTAEQRPASEAWYRGTADAVRQNIPYLKEISADYFLILSGDQLYHLPFDDMLRFAQKSNADAVIASLPVDINNAKRMGLLQVNPKQEIIDFAEKPEDPAVIRRFICPQKIAEPLRPGSNVPLYLGSMGIYLFKRDVLLDLLSSDARDDFGKHLIPNQVSKGKCFAFLYDGYWEDIGTIESFYHANMALTRQEPAFNCYLEGHPIYMARYHLPPAKILQTQVSHSIICDGSIVEAAEVSNSILGPRSVVRRGTIIKDSYVIGNDSYLNAKGESIEIGRGCIVQRAILDANVSLGNNVRLINAENLQSYDGRGLHIRNGITVVPRGTHLPDGFCL